MILGYARVSTDGQSVAAQIKELRDAGAEKIFRETASGAKSDRAALRRALAVLDADDVLLVTRLDRLARSTRDLLNTLAQIAAKGARFRSLADTWADTTTAHGRLILTVLGACLLNPGEMGFEPLKPVGEPDAANSRIRFDVRVEALRPSFVAPFPRWRSSAGCECGKGRGPPLGELQDIVGEADEAPLVGDLLDAAQEKLTEAARLLDLSEHRLGQLLS